jgi:hypothetical protein
MTPARVHLRFIVPHARIHSRGVHRVLLTLKREKENRMKKMAWLSLIAFVLAIGVASTSTAKGKNHAMTMEGTVSSVDQNAKTFSLTNKAGKATSISWTAATKVRGGSLKAGEHAQVSVLTKDGKNIATSIRIASAKMAKAS